MLKLDRSKVCKVGLAFVIVMVFWEVYDYAIPILLERTYGLSASWRGLIMGLDNILAVFLLPFFGALSDRSKGKRMGRRTPFILIGTLLAGFLVITLSLIENFEYTKLVNSGLNDPSTLVSLGFLDNNFQHSASEIHKASVAMAWDNTTKTPASFVCFIVVLLFLLVAMSTFRSPSVALMPDIVPKPLRASANAIINFMGGVGGFLSIGLYSFFAPLDGSFVNLFLLLVCVMFIFLWLYLLFVDENKFVALRYEQERKYNIIDEEEVDGGQKLSRGKVVSLLLILLSVFFWFMGYNAVRSHLSVYATSHLNISPTGVGMINIFNGFGGAIALFPVGYLSSKIGRKASTLVGFALASLAFLPCMFITPDTSYVLGVLFVLAGIGLVVVNVNTMPMVTELSNGSNVGKFTAYYYVATMAGQAISPFLAGVLMDKIHENMIFLFASISILISFIIMCFVKYGECKKIDNLPPNDNSLATDNQQ